LLILKKYQIIKDNPMNAVEEEKIKKVFYNALNPKAHSISNIITVIFVGVIIAHFMKITIPAFADTMIFIALGWYVFTIFLTALLGLFSLIATKDQLRETYDVIMEGKTATEIIRILNRIKWQRCWVASVIFVVCFGLFLMNSWWMYLVVFTAFPMLLASDAINRRTMMVVDEIIAEKT